MDKENALRILRYQLWKIGKSNGEQLWAHEYSVWHLFNQLMNARVFPLLDPLERKIMEVACLVHDYKKSTPWNQEILKRNTDIDNLVELYKEWWKKKRVVIRKSELDSVRKLFNKGKTDHQIESDRDKEFFLIPYLKKIKKKDLITFELSEENVNAIFDIIKHHFLKGKDISKSNFPGFGNYILLLKYCDQLASMEHIDVNTIDRLRQVNTIGRKLFDLTYVTISRDFGPSTCLILNKIIEIYEENNWVPLLIYEDGCIFVGNGVEIPDKEFLTKRVCDKFFEEYMKVQPISLGPKTNFVGVSKDHPLMFIESHKEKLISNLNKSYAPNTFFKLLTEILEVKSNCKIRKDYPVLDVLVSLTGGNRGIPEAVKKWLELRKEELPKKEDGKVDKSPALEHIFNNVATDEIIPSKLLKKLDIESKKLKEYQSEELYKILTGLAGLFDKDTERDIGIKSYLNEVISLEEEINFRKVALERFDAYKRYKGHPRNPKGVCEICGSTVTGKAGSDFTTIQAFTQIKADPNIPRQVCPLCAYDNSLLRQGLGNGVPIYLKIYSKISPAFEKTTWENIIKPLKDGVIRPQSISDMADVFGIPFPKVPLLLGKSDYEITDIASTKTGNETIFRLESKKKKDFSPKDYKAKYRSLYHIMNLLGFEVSIGAEEQVGLFGEEEITTRENYNKSLATILLSSIMDKSQKKYIFAENLLNNSPSVALKFVAETQKGKNFLKMKEDFAISFFEFLYNSGIELYKLDGGAYKMDDLLKDAEFFAEGIPKYCEWDWSKWNKSYSRHMATKPVSQALNEILQGRSFDMAFTKFMSNIRTNISKDKEKSEKATIDVNDLAKFVEGTKNRLMKYYELRGQNISSFIRAKNALTSAIFVFTRYDKLKEVVK